MSCAHLCNTFFEKELESPEQRPLSAWFRSHPIILQLQFLPLLYAALDDIILVTDFPENPDPRLRLLDKAPLQPIFTWGHSRAIASWTQTSIPSWDILCAINSKLFSFTHAPQLPGSALLSTEQEAHQWFASTPGPKVFKTPFGTAGQGHLHNRLPKRFPVIAEPWVEKTLDFSTQWLIQNGIHFLGATQFQTTASGTYIGTFAGKPFGPYEWALEKHLAIAFPLLEKIQALGFFGHLGIDAFVYQETRLHPIVEINGRKTMSWVALEMQKRHSGKTLFLSYTRSEKGLLPSRLNGISFERNVLIQLT